MMTSSRPRADVGGSFASRRGHSNNKLAITDSNHHVTETISTLYGEDDGYTSGNDRPLSFMPSQFPESISRQERDTPESKDATRRSVVRSHSDHASDHVSSPSSPTSPHPGIKKAQTMPAGMLSQRNNREAFDQNSRPPLSPALSLRDMDSDSSQFPLTNIDNPNDIAQELSNLQALRRLSMDVGNNIDPDMPPFSGMSLMAMPSMAPSGSDDENDPSRLLWVPARVHPELAPTEFKSFLENRVNSIKRISGDSLVPADGGFNRSNSGSLRRKKSMLSRQIDNSGGRGGVGYVDGAERLERKRSSTGGSGSSVLEVSLEELVNDPTKAVQRLAQDALRPDSGEMSAEDLPILPVAPPGMGLRRSTRTTYRKGGSLRTSGGERLPFHKRIAARQEAAAVAAESASSIGPASPDAPTGHSLTRVQSEPMVEKNYSRPSRPARRQHKADPPPGPAASDGTLHQSHQSHQNQQDQQEYQDHQGTASHISPADNHPDTQLVHALQEPQIPQIIEPSASNDLIELQAEQPSNHLPQTSSSPKASPSPRITGLSPATQTSPQQQQRSSFHEPPPRSSKRQEPAPSHQQDEMGWFHSPQSNSHGGRGESSKTDQSSAGQPVTDMASKSPSIPSGSTAVPAVAKADNLASAPVAAASEDRKADRKLKKDKDEESAGMSSIRSAGSAWKWLKGSSDDKDKKRKDEDNKKGKGKAAAEKPQDNVRLDVLQTFDGSKHKGRESLVLDRDNLDPRLQEERKKEGAHKGDAKKEKDGIFSSLFGSNKKKGDKPSGGKKHHLLHVVEETPYKPLRPDVDYHWTRFPLLEERAIYRLAHIKLANPRRSLHSQVLLSNFMYGYLAIVQAMHPQMNVPTSPQQRRLEEEQRRREHERQIAEQQQQQQQQQQPHEQRSLGEQQTDGHDQFGFDYHRHNANQYGDAGPNGGVGVADDSNAYQDGHGAAHEDDGYYDEYDAYQDKKDTLDTDTDHRDDDGDRMW